MKILIAIGVALVLVGMYGLSYNNKVRPCEQVLEKHDGRYVLHVRAAKKFLSIGRQNSCIMNKPIPAEMVVAGGAMQFDTAWVWYDGGIQMTEPTVFPKKQN